MAGHQVTGGLRGTGDDVVRDHMTCVGRPGRTIVNFADSFHVNGLWWTQ